MEIHLTSHSLSFLPNPPSFLQDAFFSVVDNKQRKRTLIRLFLVTIFHDRQKQTHIVYPSIIYSKNSKLVQTHISILVFNKKEISYRMSCKGCPQQLWLDSWNNYIATHLIPFKQTSPEYSKKHAYFDCTNAEKNTECVPKCFYLLL